VAENIAAIRSGLNQVRAAFADDHDGTTCVENVLQQGFDDGLHGGRLINGLGYDYLANDDHAVATSIFQFYVDAFPDS
jgi:hypothetical protein